MTHANVLHRIKENSFSVQIKVGESKSVIVFALSPPETAGNRGSNPKIMTPANMSHRTKENSFLCKSGSGIPNLSLFLLYRHQKPNGTMVHTPKL